MNLNISNSHSHHNTSQSHDHDHDHDLRQAVQEQLDLIIKMQQQRKGLKKENKLLHQKLKEVMQCVQKYQREVRTVETNTDDRGEVEEEKEKKEERVYQGKEMGVQIDLAIPTTSLNTSKLSQAQSLLKVLDLYQSQNQSTLNHPQPKKPPQKKQKFPQPHPYPQPQPQLDKTDKIDKNIANEMVKLTKQLNITKKQLKEMEHKFKLRDKEIKDLKKCIDNKNQALEKARKEFNQLSALMNTDKYKSVRNLQQEVQALKAKLIGQEDSSKLKTLLTQLTQQYSQYRTDTDTKLDILISELAQKQQQIQSLKKQLKAPLSFS